MEKQKEKNILIIIVIVIIAALLTLIGLLTTGKFKSNNEKDDSDANTIVDTSNYLRNTVEKVRINITDEYYEYVDINVENGSLVVKTSKYKRENGKEILDETYTGVSDNYSIAGEKIKYIYGRYYQSGSTNVIYALTESGNIYVNEFKTINNTIEVINNFKKMEYSNVEELVKVNNDDYNKVVDESGMVDTNEFYIHALIDGETVKLDKQYLG